MLDEIVKAIILEGVRIERYETLGGVLDPDVLLDEVGWILTALNELLYLELFAAIDGHHSLSLHSEWQGVSVVSRLLRRVE